MYALVASPIALSLTIAARSRGLVAAFTHTETTCMWTPADAAAFGWIWPHPVRVGPNMLLGRGNGCSTTDFERSLTMSVLECDGCGRSTHCRVCARCNVYLCPRCDLGAAICCRTRLASAIETLARRLSVEQLEKLLGVVRSMRAPSPAATVECRPAQRRKDSHSARSFSATPARSRRYTGARRS